jgi:endonuclease YncB( thermonuclease family)
MRRSILLMPLLALVASACGEPRGSATAKPSKVANALLAEKPSIVPTQGRSGAPSPRLAVKLAPPAGHDDEQPTYSSLDEVTSTTAELLNRPAKPPTTAIEPPSSGRWLVVGVHDGDTVLCLDQDNSQHKIRLVGIDAPETGQAFGTKSRDALRALVLQKSVTVHAHGQDRYGRLLGSLEIDGDDVALRMLTAGLAWHFERYSDDEELAAAERNARAARRGLWADPEPVPPWEFRASEKERKANAR